MLQIGNRSSFLNPRRYTGFQMMDVIEAFWSILTLAMVSIPYFVFMKFMESSILCFLYGLATAIIWYHVSVRKAAERIAGESAELCSRV